MKKTDELPEEYKLIYDQIGQKLINIRKREEKNYIRMAEKIGIDRKTYNLLSLSLFFSKELLVNCSK